MAKKYSMDEKKGIAILYANGRSVASICQEYDLSRSTAYHWIKKYAQIKRPSGEVTDATQIYLFEKRIKRLEAGKTSFTSITAIPIKRSSKIGLIRICF